MNSVLTRCQTILMLTCRSSIRSLFYSQLCSHQIPLKQGVISLAAIVLAWSYAPASSHAQSDGMQTLPQLEPAPTQPEPAQPTPEPAPEPAPAQPTPAQPTQPEPRPVLRVGSQGEPVSELQALLKLLGYYSGEVDGVYRANTAAAVSAFQQAVGLQADGIVGSDTWNRLLPASSSSTAAAATPTPTPTPTPSPTPATPSVTPTPAPTPTPVTTSPETTGANSATESTTETDPPAQPAQPANSNQPTQAASIDLPVLRVGLRGPAVARLQERLKTLGFYDGTIDGVFGAETQAAVQEAQRNYDLEPDGVVGPDTWTVLFR
jgi:peptidoglycan hydrolase-like protein with peptidoglycan-binding domain